MAGRKSCNAYLRIADIIVGIPYYATCDITDEKMTMNAVVFEAVTGEYNS